MTELRHHIQGQYRSPRQFTGVVAAPLLVLLASCGLTACGGEPVAGDGDGEEEPPVVILLPDPASSKPGPDEDRDQPTSSNSDTNDTPDWEAPIPMPTPPWQRGARMEREPNDLVDRGTGLDQATYFTVGESLAGALDAPNRPDDLDVDMFSVELEAGTLFRWEVSRTGEDLESQGIQTVLLGPDMRYRRELAAHAGDGRAAFIHQSGTYYLAVHDARATSSADPLPVDDSGYRIETSSEGIHGYSLEAPGTWAESLEGFRPDVHRFVWNRDEVVMAEVVCHREPVHTGIDPILYLWDTVEQRVVTHNDNGRRDSLDPQLVANLERGRPYLLIIDALAMREKVPYALSISEVDDSADVPTIIGPGSSWRAEIGAPVASMEHFDTDYFLLELAPGESIRVEVKGDDALEPALTVYREEDGFFDKIDFAAPRHGEAAVTFGLSHDARDSTLFYVLLDDLRNLQLASHEWGRRFLGGPDFDYTLRAESVHWNAAQAALPLRDEITLTESGAYHWFDVWLDAGELLSLTATSSTSDTAGQVAMMTPEGDIQRSSSTDAFFSPAAGTYRFGVREEFMRKGGTPLDVKFFSSFPRTANAPITEERHDNRSGQTAQRLHPPTRVSAYAESAHHVGYDVFVVHAKRDDKLAVWTSRDPSAGDYTPADTVLHLFDPAGEHIASNDDRMATEYTTFSALLREIEEDGDYYIVIEPYSSRMFSLDGPYMLHIALD